ncbi:MFS transporter [Streptomyces sp. M19]
MAALGALAAGTVVRSLPSVLCLFAGTVVLSAAIAFGNVLLPALIRRSVPAHRVQGVSALYVTVMGVTAAVSSGISAPLAHTVPGSWHTALAWGVVLTVVAFLVWLPRTRGDTPHAADGATRSPAPWRSRLAWQVSLFMGLQSLAFYTVVAWLPSILIHHGMSSTTAGWTLFAYQVVALAASAGLPSSPGAATTSVGSPPVPRWWWPVASPCCCPPRHCPFWRARCSVWAAACAWSSR